MQEAKAHASEASRHQRVRGAIFFMVMEKMDGARKPRASVPVMLERRPLRRER